MSSLHILPDESVGVLVRYILRLSNVLVRSRASATGSASRPALETYLSTSSSISMRIGLLASATGEPAHASSSVMPSKRYSIRLDSLRRKRSLNCGESSSMGRMRLALTVRHDASVGYTTSVGLGSDAITLPIRFSSTSVPPTCVGLQNAICSTVGSSNASIMPARYGATELRHGPGIAEARRLSTRYFSAHSLVVSFSGGANTPRHRLTSGDH